MEIEPALFLVFRVEITFNNVPNGLIRHGLNPVLINILGKFFRGFCEKFFNVPINFIDRVFAL